MSYKLSTYNKFFKRIFDLFFSLLGVILLFPIILVSFILASYDTRLKGMFTQERVGRNGKYFNLYKIRTMRVSQETNSHITTDYDNRITKFGRILRKLKIDELPQLFNVLKGDMSFVGPRPDIPGYADKLVGIDRNVLGIRPGITGLASLKYANEEKLLALVENPKEYNDMVIYPDKVKINLGYINNYSFTLDLQIILKTIFRKYKIKYE